MGRYALDIVRKQTPAPDLSAPKTIFNRPVGPHRVFDAAEFPLAACREIKDATRVTLNDVALAIVGGALLRYLEARAEVPVEGSLAASIPLDMRVRRGVGDTNNQAGSVFASLHTDLADPLARLAAIGRGTEEAKESGEASPMVDILMLAGAFAPMVAKPVAGFWARHGLSRYLPLKVTTSLSTVAGPGFPLYCAGAKLVDYYGLGALTPGMGIFHLVFSYAGKITLSVLADRDIMPDPEFYHDCLVAAFDELYGAARGPRASARTGRTGATRSGKISPERRHTKAKPGRKAKPSKR